MTQTLDRPVFTYDHYEPGKSYGSVEFTFDDGMLHKWRRVYPADGEGEGGAMPGGMLAMIVLDAVLKLNAPRPPGGVHAGQTFEVRRFPRLGERLSTEVTCLDKEIRKGRRFVRVHTRTTAPSGEILFSGVMTTIAAV